MMMTLIIGAVLDTVLSLLIKMLVVIDLLDYIGHVNYEQPQLYWFKK